MVSPSAKRQKVAAADTPPRRVVRVLGDGSSSKLARMAALWKSETLCDVRVEVEGRIFPAHRLVLASSSDYMNALLCGNRFADSSEAQIKLPDMSADAFKHALDWIYLDACNVAESDLLEVLVAASRLQCTSLIAKLENLISNSIGAETCLAVWDAADRMGLEGLAKRAKDMVTSSFGVVSKQDDFNLLSAEKVVDIISRNALIAPNEEDVFSTVIAWAKAQEQPVQASKLESVIRHVRFPSMSVDFIENQVEKEQLLLDNPSCMMQVQLSFKEKLFDKNTDRTTPRRGGTLKWSDLNLDDDEIHIRIKRDVELVRTLCKRPAPGATRKGGWHDRLEVYCGNEYVLKQSEIRKHMHKRSLLLDGNFWPFDALEWV